MRTGSTGHWFDAQNVISRCGIQPKTVFFCNLSAFSQTKDEWGDQKPIGEFETSPFFWYFPVGYDSGK